MIGLERGKKGAGDTRYTLNTLFHDDGTRSVLQKAGEEVRAYMEQTGFGVVDVWKVWSKYRSMLPEGKALPKLGFYMMMRDVEAGGLCYKDYPKIAYTGVDVCENVYWWELFEYFHYCGHPKASFEQIMSFFVDCLGIQPDIANSCAFHYMGLEKEEPATGALYVIRRPPNPSKTPKVLLEMVKKDEHLTLLKSRDKYAARTDYFDENGRARTYPTYVKLFLRELVKSGGEFSDEELGCLMDVEWCKTNLKISKPLLKKVGGAKMVKGQGYWLEEFKFGNELFYACAQWTQKNKSAFDAWAVGKAEQVGLPFEPYEIGTAADDESFIAG